MRRAFCMAVARAEVTGVGVDRRIVVLRCARREIARRATHRLEVVVVRVTHGRASRRPWCIAVATATAARRAMSAATIDAVA